MVPNDTPPPYWTVRLSVTRVTHAHYPDLISSLIGDCQSSVHPLPTAGAFQNASIRLDEQTLHPPHRLANQLEYRHPTGRAACQSGDRVWSGLQGGSEIQLVERPVNQPSDLRRRWKGGQEASTSDWHVNQFSPRLRTKQLSTSDWPNPPSINSRPAYPRCGCAVKPLLEGRPVDHPAARLPCTSTGPAVGDGNPNGRAARRSAFHPPSHDSRLAGPPVKHPAAPPHPPPLARR
ncbi:hypothetical protein chiPu_0021456 [Chiloscyllium punctatum]|uniref:Uncharacterized protein n=1 Tax=Chiloscyllium punctatum TaxID=137246 RepID=A0A401RFQ5_CHIPU|nr:hypothetical protein [Chiloscyllium punctatum]